MQATPRFVAAIVIALCAVSHLTSDNRWLAAAVAVGLASACNWVGRCIERP